MAVSYISSENKFSIQETVMSATPQQGVFVDVPYFMSRCSHIKSWPCAIYGFSYTGGPQIGFGFQVEAPVL